MKSPLALVKEKFQDKATLVAALEKFTNEDLWVSKTNKGKGLAHVSNAKLLRLHQTFSAVKEKFGTRFKLVDAIAELEKRTKDEGYRTRLLQYPVPRLFDLYRSLEKRGAKSKSMGKAPEKKTAAAATPKTAKKSAAAKSASTPAKKPPAKKATSRSK